MIGADGVEDMRVDPCAPTVAISLPFADMQGSGEPATPRRGWFTDRAQEHEGEAGRQLDVLWGHDHVGGGLPGNVVQLHREALIGACFKAQKR